MVASKSLMIYILFLIFFSFFYTNIVGSNEINDFSITNFMPFSGLRESMGNWGGIGVALTLPFLALDFLISIMFLIGFSFVNIPIYLNLLILTPLGYFIIVDYVLPYIRGN